MELLSVAEARERILTRLRPVSKRTMLLDACAGRVLSEDVLASTDLPPFDNSSMDGFAVRSADLDNDVPHTLRVVADIPAGSIPVVTLKAGQAARIMTGAPVPAGADAVIPVEDTDFRLRDAGAAPPSRVKITRSARAGENIRPRGMDMKAGEVILQAGRVLRAQEIGLLAMIGMSKVPVYRRPRVALFSSGDELLPVDQPLAPGKIHDSNSHMLAALVRKAGAQLIPLGVAPDRREAVTALLERAARSRVDLILSSAGVSVGAFDFVKEIVDANGRLDFWRVNMRPGKPLAFGEYRSIPFIGLPGNPVSAFVGFQAFVDPAIQRLRGVQDIAREVIRVRLGEAVRSDGRESYLRAEVRFQPEGAVAFLTGHQGSANLAALVMANALLIIPAGVKSAPAGWEVDAWIL